MPPGPFQGEVTLLGDVHYGRYGNWALGSVDHHVLLVDLGSESASRGDELSVRGILEGEPGRAAGRVYDGVLDITTIDGREASRFLPHRAGAWVRSTVLDHLEPFDDGRALLAGFLIGDTSRIDPADVEAMRRSGLAHFVAVSGSNVALFLGLLAVAAGPLALGPKRRATLGLVGLPVYAAATRFEPSVLRASLMAALALVGRLIGVVLEAWQLLSLAVALLVVLDPALTSNVGFQLSVAATMGVLVGARWPVRGAWRRALAVTLGAQLSVAPLLLFHFGAVPVLSPLVNLAAAPLVTAATVTGALGVSGLGFLLGPASWGAELVLWLARGAAGWPQLGPWSLGGVVLLGLCLTRLERWRPLVVMATAATIVWVGAFPAQLAPGTVVVLDVGQGDSILLGGGQGRYALVDGGPDPALLRDRLSHYGVDRLELVVLTHPHADHATGLIGLVGQIPIAEVWADTTPHTTEASGEFFAALGEYAVPRVAPRVGQSHSLGLLQLRVLGPVRRYASPNDQSIVIEVSAARSMLLTGDIETFAQSDLEMLRADVLKVPHQGGATSDPQWLSAVGAELAVISVGPNQFGHPAEWVIDVLEDSGAEVLRTDRDGDVAVDLTEPVGLRPG
jgi:competence protein ComEC